MLLVLATIVFLVVPGGCFSFPNPLLKLTTDNDVKAMKQDSNTPPDDTDGGGDVYVGPPRNRFLERKLKDDDVLIPCSECMKLVDRYVGACALYEASLRPLITVSGVAALQKIVFFST